MMLKQKGHTTQGAANGHNALEKLGQESFDMMFSDIRMPEMDGRALIREMRQAGIYTPVVFITAFATVDSAVEMMRSGAADYITKPFNEEKILVAVERALRISHLIAENQAMRQQLQQADEKYTLVYRSHAMKEIVKLAANVAAADTAVLITGESGTGKELIARYIHMQSHRNGTRFVPVNCAAISANLVESELFGHEKGAFTGAARIHKGKFEYADQGTLFLDEIGDLPLESQAKILRALQEKRFQRVGGNQEIPVNVRIICATNRNLEKMVHTEQFRRDLFFRINVFPIDMPPLRRRKEDIIPLAVHFLKISQLNAPHELTEGACRKLTEYTWPGNVRELANVMERAMILSRESGKITSDTLSFLQVKVPTGDNNAGLIKLPADGIQLHQVQVALVKQALEASGNNQTAAAKLLGLSRAKFRVLLKNIEDKNREKKEICRQ